MTVEAYAPPALMTVQGTGPYAFNHAVRAAEDLDVWIEAGTARTLLAAPAVSVSLNGGSPGGTVTLSPAAAAAHAGATLRIDRTTRVEQGWAGATAREKGLERQLDATVMAVQELHEVVDRAIVLPRGDGAVPELPFDGADRAGLLLGFDGQGNPQAVAPSQGMTVSSKSEAEAGTNNSGLMTPLRANEAAKALDAGLTPERFGALATGSSAAAIVAAMASGQLVDLRARTYDVQALDTLDVSKLGQAPAGAVLQSVIGNALVRDRDGRPIGFAHNHRQQSMWTGAYPRNVVGAEITTGNLIAPPISQAEPVAAADLCAHHYGRQWGNKWMRMATGIGSAPFDRWYDWGWNWVGSSGYDQDRHPVQGWYRQDDPNVLDWQCYWMREAGIKAICPVSFELNISTWHQPQDVNHWIYQMFNATPNFRGMSYIPWVQSEPFDSSYPAPTAGQVVIQWDNIIFGLCDTFPNNYVMHHLGKRWMVVYAWNSDYLLNTVFGGNVSAYRDFLRDRASSAITRGYDGLAVLFHTPTSAATLDRDALLDDHVLYLHSPYSGPWASPGATTYAEVVNQFNPPLKDIVPTATTALKSVPPISVYNLPGSTPALFQRYLAKCLELVRRYPDIPDLVMLGHAAEWAEGGAGLIPSRGAGWAYLDAIRAAAAREGRYGSTLWPRALLSLLNGWQDYAPGTAAAMVSRGSDRTIILSGVIKNGATAGGTIVATLPAWAWPKENMVFPVVVNGGGTSSILIRASDGAVVAFGALNSVLTSLCGITYRTA